MGQNVISLFDLSGRTAIVTGGSRGIGKEMAEGLAEAGANLVLCARRPEWLDKTTEEFTSRGFQVESALCDVSKAAEVEKVIAAAVSRFGSVDVLVNNAGTSWGAMPEDMTVEQWQKVWT